MKLCFPKEHELEATWVNLFYFIYPKRSSKVSILFPSAFLKIETLFPKRTWTGIKQENIILRIYSLSSSRKHEGGGGHILGKAGQINKYYLYYLPDNGDVQYLWPLS
jgi:hypothetical protein